MHTAALLFVTFSLHPWVWVGISICLLRWYISEIYLQEKHQHFELVFIWILYRYSFVFLPVQKLHLSTIIKIAIKFFSRNVWIPKSIHFLTVPAVMIFSIHICIGKGKILMFFPEKQSYQPFINVFALKRPHYHNNFSLKKFQPILCSGASVTFSVFLIVVQWELEHRLGVGMLCA